MRLSTVVLLALAILAVAAWGWTAVGWIAVAILAVPVLLALLGIVAVFVLRRKMRRDLQRFLRDLRGGRQTVGNGDGRAAQDGVIDVQAVDAQDRGRAP